MRARFVSAVLATGLAAGLVGTASPAFAASGATTLHVQSAAASFRVSSPIVVTGTVKPASTATVVLERLNGKHWLVLAHAKPTTAGAFGFTVKAPKAAATWPVRVVRAAGKAVKAGTSGTVKLHIVKTAFTVSTPVAAGVVLPNALTLHGSLKPAATGTLTVQSLVGKVWQPLVSLKLHKAVSYGLSKVLPVGTYHLRASMPATTTVAAGLSKSVAFVVSAAPVPVQVPAIAVTTLSLPSGQVGVAYSAQLSAGSGTAPYSFVASGLPAGLTATAAGAITGYPTAVGTSNVVITAVDAHAVTGSATLSLTIALPATAANQVRDWGNNTYGQLGNNSTTASEVPVSVTGLTGVVSVAGGNATSVAAKYDGTVWAWGSDNEGELGDNLALLVHGTPVPVQVAGLTGVKAVASNNVTVYALKNDGTVWAWGFNNDGQIGDGTTTERNVPVPVLGLSSVTAIAAGANAGYALKADGTLWSWGDNTTGELGTGGTDPSLVPVKVDLLTGVTAVSAGTGNAAAVTSNGTVWTWGDNTSGQIGDTTTTQRDDPTQVLDPAGTAPLTGIAAVATGQQDNYAMTTTGGVYSWGAGDLDKLGTGGTADVHLPVATAVTGAVSIAAGTGLYVRLGDGTEKDWGSNGGGQIGDGTVNSQPVPTVIPGLSHVLAVAGSSSVGYAITSG